MFDTFRKRQKTLLAALAVMAMFAFAFLPGVSLGPTGKGSIDKDRDKVVADIYGRKVTKAELEDAKHERFIANAFVRELLATMYGPEIVQRMPAEYFDIQFGFGPTNTDEAIKDAMRLNHKADEFGVKVSDDMVRDWIKSRTGGRMTADQFEAVVKRLGRVSEGISVNTLFEVLRRQMRVRRVEMLVTGAQQVTPFEAWQFYRRMNDKFAFEVIPVKVSDFTDSIADPGDKALREVYDKFVSRLPNPNSPEPGFKEPHKVDVQFASISLEGFLLASRPEIQVSEEEMKNYYDSHKYQYIILPNISTDEPAELPEKPKLEGLKPVEMKKDDSPEKKDGDDKKPTEKPAESPPAKPESKSDKPDDGSCEDADDPQEKPGEPKEKPSTPAAAKADDAKKTDEPKKTDENPDDAKSKSEKPTPARDDPQPPESKDDAKPTEKGEPETPKTDDPEKTDAMPQPPPLEYKSFDDVKQEIADLLAKNKARDEVFKRMRKIQTLVNRFADDDYLPKKTEFDRAKEKNPKLEFTPPEPPDLTKQAEELGFTFARTGLVSLAELSKVATLGSASEVVGETATGRHVTAVMGGAERDPILFDPLEMMNDKDEYIVAWKVADVPASEPPFDTIRDKVLAAYRAIEARKPAKEHAEKLAQALRDAGGDMAKLREAKPEIESISVPAVPMWTEFGGHALFGPGRIEPTTLPGVDQPGDAFRDAVFKLNEGDAGVALNHPEDTYYVLLVTTREPASRESFGRSRTTVESRLREQQSREQAMQWLTELRQESSPTKPKAPAGN